MVLFLFMIYENYLGICEELDGKRYYVHNISTNY